MAIPEIMRDAVGWVMGLGALTAIGTLLFCIFYDSVRNLFKKGK